MLLIQLKSQMEISFSGSIFPKEGSYAALVKYSRYNLRNTYYSKSYTIEYYPRNILEIIFCKKLSYQSVMCIAAFLLQNRIKLAYFKELYQAVNYYPWLPLYDIQFSRLMQHLYLDDFYKSIVYAYNIREKKYLYLTGEPLESDPQFVNQFYRLSDDCFRFIKANGVRILREED